jgi:rhodanese-related sulfurtransferase
MKAARRTPVENPVDSPVPEALMQRAVPRPKELSFITRVPPTAILAVVVVVVFAGGLIAGRDAQGLLHPNRHILEKQAEPVAGGVGIVTAEQVVAAGRDNYELVDVRGRDAYDFAHAVGAIVMPESEIDKVAGTLPTDRTLVLYCTCPDEKTSLRAARTLAEVYHLDNLVVLKGGMLAYRSAGGKLSSDASDSAIEHQGCGCTVNSPAFKLWVMNNDARAALPNLSPFK